MSAAQPEDGALRELFQGLPRERSPGEECPPPEELWASARGELAPDRNREVIAHTGRCPSCAEDWRLARHVARNLPAGVSVATRPAPGSRPYWRLAAAAGLLLALALGGLWTLRGRLDDRGAAYRDQGRPEIESLIPGDRPLSRDEPVLRWRGPEGATYRLVVTTDSLEVVFIESGIAATRLRLPRSALEGLPSGTLLLWRLEAVLPDGRRYSSGTFRLSLE